MDRDHTNTKLAPTQVITIYNNKWQTQYYLEHREIIQQGEKLLLMAPTPMSEDVFRNIATSYMKERATNITFEGLIPAHILYGYSRLGMTVVIWYRPAMKRLLNFSSALGIKGEKWVQVPATLYAIVGGSLYVFALMSSERPDLKTKLYKAPFFNIYEDGNVCLGTARIGKKTPNFEGEADRYERAFYMAEQNGGHSTQNCKTPLTKLWSMLIQSQAPFPVKEELIQHKHSTLGDFINRVISKATIHETEE